jgi:hypothetical protein
VIASLVETGVLKQHVRWQLRKCRFCCRLCMWQPCITCKQACRGPAAESRPVAASECIKRVFRLFAWPWQHSDAGACTVYRRMLCLRVLLLVTGAYVTRVFVLKLPSRDT